MLMASFIIFILLVFVVLVFMLNKIMTQNVTSATQHIDELNQDYTKKDEDINRRWEEVKRQAEDIVRKAQEEGEKTKIELIKGAEAEKEQIIKQARVKSEEMVAQAEKSCQALLSEIEARIAKEAMNKAVGLIHDVLPDKFKRNVHNEWVDGLIANGFNQLNNIGIPDNVSEVLISAAFPLTANQREELIKKLSSVLNRQITLKEEVDPKLVAGLVITIASLVFDGTLKNKIMEKAR
ncbi:MAG TPA: F0F1 ATP synthase subunit delta [Candidatus Omnitrophota bacterium]|nr:F0F1 ATP synthase subunit delta [Candidatus Omnitrophota bacterium]HPT39471.1 F0F1 ATP synthase subunit delta [Candidatus Omnitrophota bacterium]